jgi:hypothetical protein
MCFMVPRAGLNLTHTYIMGPTVRAVAAIAPPCTVTGMVIPLLWLPRRLRREVLILQYL